MPIQVFCSFFNFFFAIELYESFIRYVIFPHSVGCFFILLMVPFAGQTLFSSLMKNHVFIFASLVAQLVNNPPAMRDTWVRSLGWEDPLETVNATHPVFWPGESMDSPRGRQEQNTTGRLSLSLQCQIQNTVTTTSIRKSITFAFFQEFYGFRSQVKVFNSF